MLCHVLQNDVILQEINEFMLNEQLQVKQRPVAVNFIFYFMIFVSISIHKGLVKSLE